MTMARAIYSLYMQPWLFHSLQTLFLSLIYSTTDQFHNMFDHDAQPIAKIGNQMNERIIR